MNTGTIVALVLLMVAIFLFLLWVFKRSADDVKRLDPQAWERMQQRGDKPTTNDKDR